MIYIHNVHFVNLIFKYVNKNAISLTCFFDMLIKLTTSKHINTIFNSPEFEGIKMLNIKTPF